MDPDEEVEATRSAKWYAERIRSELLEAILHELTAVAGWSPKRVLRHLEAAYRKVEAKDKEEIGIVLNTGDE